MPSACGWWLRHGASRRLVSAIPTDTQFHIEPLAGRRATPPPTSARRSATASAPSPSVIREHERAHDDGRPGHANRSCDHLARLVRKRHCRDLLAAYDRQPRCVVPALPCAGQERRDAFGYGGDVGERLRKEANGCEWRGGQEAARTVVPLQEKTVRPEPVKDGVSAFVSFQLRPPSPVQSCRCPQWQADPDVTLITPSRRGEPKRRAARTSGRCGARLRPPSSVEKTPFSLLCQRWRLSNWLV